MNRIPFGGRFRGRLVMRWCECLGMCRGHLWHVLLEEGMLGRVLIPFLHYGLLAGVVAKSALESVVDSIHISAPLYTVRSITMWSTVVSRPAVIEEYRRNQSR